MPKIADPAISRWAYLNEAVSAIEALYPLESVQRHLHFKILNIAIAPDEKVVRKSDLATLRRLFDQTADAAEIGPFASAGRPCDVRRSASAGTQAMKVSEALATRKTIRAFKPDAVPTKTLVEIVEKAARAPSGGNLQPWKTYVLNGAARDELVRRTAEERAKNPRGEMPEYHIYPPELTEPFKTRRFRVGEMMYETMNIPREDKMARLKFFGGNWSFFGAPAGFIFTVDRQMQQGQWSDVGMFLQSIMLLAREYGLDTCPQEAWAVWHRIIRAYLNIPENEMIFCGMAIGYADTEHPVNHLLTERAPLSEYVTVKEEA